MQHFIDHHHLIHIKGHLITDHCGLDVSIGTNNPLNGSICLDALLSEMKRTVGQFVDQIKRNFL